MFPSDPEVLAFKMILKSLPPKWLAGLNDSWTDVFSPLGTNEKFYVVLTAIEALISGLCESSGPWNHNLLVSLCTHTLIPDIQVMSGTASFS